MVTSVPPDFGGDEFENRARAALRGDEQRLARLLELRRLVSVETSQFHERTLDPNATVPSAEELNDAYNRFFYEAAELLGNERFEQVFGVPAGEPVNLVDPEVFASVPATGDSIVPAFFPAIGADAGHMILQNAPVRTRDRNSALIPSPSVRVLGWIDAARSMQFAVEGRPRPPIEMRVHPCIRPRAEA